MAQLDAALEQEIFRVPQGQQTYIVTGSRITSGLVRKYRNGLRLVSRSR